MSVCFARIIQSVGMHTVKADTVLLVEAYHGGTRELALCAMHLKTYEAFTSEVQSPD